MTRIEARCGSILTLRAATSAATTFATSVRLPAFRTAAATSSGV